MVNIPTWGKKFRANPEGTPGLPPWGHNIDRCITHACPNFESGWEKRILKNIVVSTSAKKRCVIRLINRLSA
jgi:hypothetical protein